MWRGASDDLREPVYFPNVLSKPRPFSCCDHSSFIGLYPNTALDTSLKQAMEMPYIFSDSFQ